MVIMFVGNIVSNMGDLELHGKLHFVCNDNLIAFLMPFNYELNLGRLGDRAKSHWFISKPIC